MNPFELKLLDSSQYKDLKNDLVKYFTILIVVNFLMKCTYPDKVVLLGKNYMELMLFILCGIITYWLVIYEIFYFD